MKLPLTTTYALRSLRRHVRRTLLSVVGIGVGCALCLFIIGWVRGEKAMIRDAAAGSGLGHLAVAPTDWLAVRTHDFRLPAWEATVETLRRDPAIAVVMPSARCEALLAMGTRVQGVEMVGVDPAAERQANRLVRNVVEGRYLEPDERGGAVLGSTLLDRLDVELGDDLVVTVAGAGGQMSSAMLRIVGVVATGSRDLDASVCHVSLAQMAELTGRPGPTLIGLMLREPDDLEAIAARLPAQLPEGASLVAWSELRPELAAGVEVDETWAKLITGIIMTVVFLGIASAQLAAVLERRREFAVLSSLGMPAGRIVQVMIAEAVMLGLAGAVLGLLLGTPATWYVATYGIDFSKLLEGMDISFSNTLMDPVFKGDFGWWLVPLALLLSLLATLLSSLYPAWYAIKTDPATALRVDH